MPRLGGHKKKREFVRQLNPDFLKRERRHDSVVGEYERLKVLEATKRAALEDEEKQKAEKARKEEERAHRARAKHLEQTKSLASEFTNVLGETSFQTQCSKELAEISSDFRNAIGDENCFTTYHGAPKLETATASSPNDEWSVSNDWNEVEQPMENANKLNSPTEIEWTQIPKRRKAIHQPVNTEKTLNEGGCFNCGGDHKKADCPEPIKPKGTCHQCNQRGHFVKDCPQIPGGGKGSGSGRTCYNCGEVGHFSKECPSEGSGSSKPIICYNCHKEGHKGRDCPEDPKGTRHFAGSCYNCGETGHQSRSCPVKDPSFSLGSDSRFTNAKTKSGVDDLDYTGDFNSGFEISGVENEPFESTGNGLSEGEISATNEAKSDEMW